MRLARAPSSVEHTRDLFRFSLTCLTAHKEPRRRSAHGGVVMLRVQGTIRELDQADN